MRETEESRESPYTRYAKTICSAVGAKRKLPVRHVKVDARVRRKDAVRKCGLQIGS